MRIRVAALGMRSAIMRFAPLAMRLADTGLASPTSRPRDYGFTEGLILGREHSAK